MNLSHEGGRFLGRTSLLPLTIEVFLALSRNLRAPPITLLNGDFCVERAEVDRDSSLPSESSCLETRESLRRPNACESHSRPLYQCREWLVGKSRHHRSRRRLYDGLVKKETNC